MESRTNPSGASYDHSVMHCVCHEYKVEGKVIGDCTIPKRLALCDTPDKAVEYWRMHIERHKWFDPEKEMLITMFLDTKLCIKGHTLVGLGTLDSLSTTPREVFRCAIVLAAKSIVLMHNHPSSNPEPSREDIRLTRNLSKAGSLLGIELIDHIIVGHPTFVSLKKRGIIQA